MAEKGKKTQQQSLVDPIYESFVKGVIRSVGSTDFYEFFMDAIQRANNVFQFSNRRMEKTVDITWVDAIDAALGAFEVIISSPRNVIKEEELIVNVANARKTGSDTIRHLAQHSSLVENFDAKKGEVRPNKLMQKYKEETVGLYENRLVFTTLEYAYNFVKKRHEALFAEMGDEFGAKLKVNSDMTTSTELVHLDMFLQIKDVDSALETDEKNAEVFGRISKLYRVLSVFMGSDFSQQLAKLGRVKGNITKTNVLKKNPNYKKIAALYDFLRQYNDIGYSIKIVEQKPVVNEQLQRDIYHNIMFNYLILKGYLESEKDRELPASARGRKLKPKFIKEIIEELTEDYDLPDVEIRKVLIEELTKAQLMQEEKEERRRLVEEQQQRKKEEEARIKAERLAEKERLKAEKEAEKERLRAEKEAEAQRLRQEQMERELEDRRLKKLYNAELEFFRDKLAEQLEARERQKEERAAQTEDFADAVKLLEEAEEREKEEKRLALIRQREEKERQRREEEAERERIRIEAEEKQRAEDEFASRAVIEEITFFASSLFTQKVLRAAEDKRRLDAQKEFERAIKERRKLRKR